MTYETNLARLGSYCAQKGGGEGSSRNNVRARRAGPPGG